MNKWWMISIGVVVLAIVGIFLARGGMQGINPQNNNAPSPQITNSAMLEEKGKYEVEAEDVSYFENAKGFFARPKEQGNYPGVVMIHEWWGLNDNIKDMAHQLASQGYAVLAVDLYSGKVAQNQQEAVKYVSSVDQAKANENMKAAVSYLKQQGAGKIASLGWCFGGGQSLQLALSGQPLDATILYYGTPLVTDKAKLSVIKWPILGIFGDKDQAIPVDSIKTFDNTIDSLGIKNEVHIYPGVGHAFANPSGQNYAPSETKDAWGKTLNFLSQNLK